MNLPPPVPRTHKHTRRITCEGYRRDDGLWDIDARIVDTKTYRYTEPDRGSRAIGEPVHDMSVRLTIDDAMIVRDIVVVFSSNPYAACLGAAPNFKGLIGAKVGLGWRKAVQACVGGTNGCTHVRELLFPMATVAFQTMSGWAADDDESPDGRADKASERAAGRASDGSDAASRAEGERGAPRGPSGGDDRKPYFIDGCKAWASTGDVVARFHPRFHRPAGG